MNERFYFDRAILDRAAHLRQEPDQQHPDLAGVREIVLPVWRDRSLVWLDKPSAVKLDRSDAAWFEENASILIFLGLEGGVAYYGAELSHLDAPEDAPLPDGASFEDLRRLASTVESTEAGYLAYARALSYWNRTHQYCGACGSPTISRRSGHERKCSNEDCSRSHFPRTDPAVIMLVTHPSEEKCLLGHNKRFQGLRYSTIAGFVEPGESLEHAVAREVYEETGIHTVEQIYQASQPWPFPASIMLGFRAVGVNVDVDLIDNELLDARWFSRDEVHEMAEEGNILPPPGYSISRWLIDTWLSEK